MRLPETGKRNGLALICLPRSVNTEGVRIRIINIEREGFFRIPRFKIHTINRRLCTL